MAKALRLIVGLLLIIGFIGAALYFFAPDKIVEAGIHAERSNAKLSQQNVTINVGQEKHSIPYLIGGPEQAPIIVMLHGYTGNKDNWPRFAQYFTQDYRVIIPDLPGFGEASKLYTASYDIDSQRLRLEAFIKALGLAKVHIMGNSMGGWLSAAMVQQNSENFLSLGLLDSAGVLEPAPSEFTKAILRGENLLLVNSAEDIDRAFALAFTHPPKLPSIARDYLAQKAIADKPFNIKVAGDLMAKPYPLDNKLNRIAVPTYILWGADDRIIDKSAAAVFAQGIANSSSHILADTGHVPMIEKPKQSAELYRRFLTSISNK